MDKSKVILLVGESASGKDTVMREIVSCINKDSENSIPRIHQAVSYTTRPMRKGELEGREYIFLRDNDQFDTMYESGFLYESTSYTTNFGVYKYGLGKESFVNDIPNITIVNPHGINQLMNSELKDRIIIFYITAPLEERFRRYMNRDEMTPKQKIELVDRICRDDKDFTNFKYNPLITQTFDTTSIPSKEVGRIIAEYIEIL